MIENVLDDREFLRIVVGEARPPWAAGTRSRNHGRRAVREARANVRMFRLLIELRNRQIAICRFCMTPGSTLCRVVCP
jgi:hypothetical protein